MVGRSGVYEMDEVKGLVLVTARRHLTESFGEERYLDLVSQVSDAAKASHNTDSLHSWYPEAHLAELIRVIHRDLAGGDDDRFLEIVHGLALAGISRFFKMLMNLGGSRFVLKKVPVIFKRLRRGPAQLHAVVETQVIRIHYEHFSFCADPVYRLLSLGNCQALALAAGGKVPRSFVEEHGRSSMTLRFEVGGKGGSRSADEPPLAGELGPSGR